LLEFVLTPSPVQAFSEGDNQIWIEALPARTYKTSMYGEVPVTMEKLDRMVKNFRSNVRGQEIAVDFEHGADRSKGYQAAGWYRDFDIRPSTSDPGKPALFALVDFTDEAKQEIEAKKWKYFSLEWDDLWEDSDGQEHRDVVIGGGITNRPIAKKTLPINFSENMKEELTDEEKKEFAVWSTAFVNDLPDSAFLYISPGGKKDSEGKTVPRSLRHLPYKDKSGKIDLPHLRNAIARIPQMKGIGADLKARLQAKARRLLGGKTKAASETATEEAYDLLTAEGFEVFDESKEMEHSEPGTGTPPEPRTDEDGSDDIAIKEGWRRFSPPDQEVPLSPSSKAKGGSKVSEFAFAEKDARELFHVLDLDSDTDPAKVVETIKVKFGELETLRDSASAHDQEKAFAEQYPQYWNEHMKLMERDRENTAKTFCESVSRIRKTEGYSFKETKQGLSVEALNKIAQLHKKFAEGTATLEEFEECIKAITNGGIVAFGEVGSSSADDDLPDIDVSSPTGIAQSRKLFAEVVKKIQQENPEMEYTEALEKASKKHPDLAEAYAVSLPG
jgi:hypothetical protein